MVLWTKNYNLLLLTVQYVIQQCACLCFSAALMD